jgi:superfamily II DNA or RNA helicase
MNLTPEQIQHIVTTMSVGERKSWLQEMGYNAWIGGNRRGTMEMATGTGKTRIGIKAAADTLKRDPLALVYIVVPTETLRDTDWPEEMKAAGYEGLEEKVQMICWKSLSSEKPERDVDLVVLDEVHHVTVQNTAFFNRDSYKVWNVLGLTATLPDDEFPDDRDKLAMIQALCPPVFKIDLGLAIALKIVTDYEMYVLKFDLDDKDTYIETSKGKRTESQRYKELTKMMQRATFMKNEGMKFVAIQKRTEFLYNLRTKERLARDVIQQVMQKQERTILFCGSIDQSVKLCGKQVYNSKTTTEYLDLFRDEKISYLGVVQALNEGKNLPNIDQILVIQLTSKELNLIQRIGRAIRWRENHIPKIIILIAKGTADEKWYKKATRSMSRSRIKEYYVKPEVKTA